MSYITDAYKVNRITRLSGPWFNYFRHGGKIQTLFYIWVINNNGNIQNEQLQLKDTIIESYQGYTKR